MAGGSPAGAGVALAPVGPPGGGPGSEYGAYYSQIRQRIQETLEYPPAARRQGIKGTVLLELLIKPDGAISAVVKVSSSHRLLDDAALETVRNLPRQPFPAGLVPRQLKVPLPVVFDLK
jgi:protein TonB